MSSNARLWRHTALLWIVLPLSWWLQTVRPPAAVGDRALRLPAALGSFVQAEEYPLSDDELAMLGTADAVARRYQDTDGSVFLFAVFHDADWKSVHPPHTCLLGSNMEIEVDDRRELAAGGPWVGRLVCWSVDRERRYLSLYAYLAPPDRVRDDYWDFFWHNAPRALLRRSNAGALVRVETWIDDEDLARAERRCGRFLAAALPELFDCFR